VNSNPRLIAVAIGALALAIAIAVWHGLSADNRAPLKQNASPPTAAESSSPPAPPPAAPSPPDPPATAQNAPPDAAAPSPAVAATVARMNEAVLMAHLREVARTDSAQAIEIARAGNKRFPDTPDAPERTSILIHALITQDKLSEGRAEAEYMVNHFPDSKWVREIEGFTGAHRHRNIRVNDAGQLEYY
jgi:alkanesulfonate monooxygenase SsuD/methylene tetrahydromethanopterin reductase-like flavin-dependent oxidoreductase (luciferase family)